MLKLALIPPLKLALMDELFLATILTTHLSCACSRPLPDPHRDLRCLWSLHAILAIALDWLAALLFQKMRKFDQLRVGGLWTSARLNQFTATALRHPLYVEDGAAPQFVL
jgi:hypothetical protein